VRWSELAGRRVLVLGAGREGRAVAARLAAEGEDVRAVDELDGEAAAQFRAELGERVPLLVAPGVDELRGADVAIASPGIPPHSALRRAVAELGIPETSETDLWLGDHAAETTAVTGSKGKSTTAALIHALSLAHGVDAQLGGNIGVPLLTLPAAERYVAELSSYQASSVTASPDVVALTALFPEHLDWHGDEEAYYAAKLNLAAHGARRVLYNAADPRLAATVARLLPDVDAEPVGRIPPAALEASPLLGRHNEANLAIALAAVEAAGTTLDEARVVEALAAFRPLQHRLEPIEDPSGLVFVDDSLSTSPYAAIAALEALEGREIVLVVGGQDRGVDYAPLAEHLAAHPVDAVIGLPDSGPRILAALSETGVLTVPVDGMEAAVRSARRLAAPGGTVLLSPAAPSYGRYRDYADRAADFRRAISATAD